jgi:hypothetical protein
VAIELALIVLDTKMVGDMVDETAALVAVNTGGLLRAHTTATTQ